jgi:glycosyltransferase involved in cell wall biosynthesis
MPSRPADRRDGSGTMAMIARPFQGEPAASSGSAERASRPDVSVVIPVYCAQESLPELIQRLVAVLSGLGERFEIVCVDDCSPDNSWQVLKELKGRYPDYLRIVRLLTNSGQHNALLCGFHLCHGQIVVTMDDDLQNPPEEMPALVAAVRSGFDLAIGAYDVKQHAKLRNYSGGLVDRINRYIFHLPDDFQLTSFRAVHHRVIDNVCQMGGVFPYVTSMLLSHTSRRVNVSVRHDPRKYGASHYTLRRSLRLAFNLILSYSTLPVQFVGVLCLGAFVFSMGFGGWVMARALLAGISVQGWASTIVILSFFNGITLLCLFIFSLYLSRMNQQLTRSRVSFTIAEMHDG